MRKIMALALCLVLACFLFACQNTQSQAANPQETTLGTDPIPTEDYSNKVFTFPEGTVIFGQDISGMYGNKARTVLEQAVDEYTLCLILNGQPITLTAKDMGLQFSEEQMVQYIDAIKSGKDPSAYIPVSYNPNQLRSRIAVCSTVMPQNVTIVYDAESNSFVFQDAIPGTVYDLDPVIQELESVITSLDTEHATIAVGRDLEAPVTAESETAIAALEKANTQLRTALTYSFTPDNSQTRYASLTVDDIGSFLTFDSNLNTKVDRDAVYAYALQLQDRYSVGTNDGLFLTSLGYYEQMDIKYADQLVDVDALCEDIVYCVENSESGLRVATYLPKEKGWSHDLGGNYVEVNLTEQCLWVYNNYECVMFTPVVTGCVANNWHTVTGAFDVVYKELYTQLMGLDVTYWMPFHGNFGLHDACWRTNFANTEYLFNGSHGCVNIPPANARAVFHNVSWDTPVIVYGGVNKNNPVTQEITGTTEYHVGINASNFYLDATPKYGYKSRLTYTCDNTDVVTVSRKGEITVVSPGTAKITIESPDWSFCPTDSIVVTITVHDNCTDQGHLLEWKETTAPTCTTTGIETGTCTVCGKIETRSVEVRHRYDKWVITTAATCTTEGQQERMCVTCGHVETESIAPHGHSFNNFRIKEDSTETTEGIVTGTCYHCGATTTQVLPVKPSKQEEA